jgi:hypothetical protein
MIIVNCAKCGKKVDHIEQWQDQANLDMAFRAHCHGASEETRIPLAWFRSGDVTIISAEAFKEQKQEDIKNICGNE